MYNIGIAQAAKILEANEIDTIQFIDWADEDDWTLLIRDIKKTLANRKHNAANPKPKRSKRQYVQRTKGRTPEAIVKGMI